MWEDREVMQHTPTWEEIEEAMAVCEAELEAAERQPCLACPHPLGAHLNGVCCGEIGEEEPQPCDCGAGRRLFGCDREDCSEK